MRRNTRRNRRRGGAATVYPINFFDPAIQPPDAGAGRNLLEAIPPIGVRPRIGGNRRTRRNMRRGGFVPSVMDGFASAASTYIVPVALFAGYKLMTRKGKKGKRYTRRR